MGCAGSNAASAVAPGEAVPKQGAVLNEEGDEEHVEASRAMLGRGQRERLCETPESSSDLSAGSLNGSSRSRETADARKRALGCRTSPSVRL